MKFGFTNDRVNISVGHDSDSFYPEAARRGLNEHREQPQTYLMHENINSVTIIITLEGIENLLKLRKMQKQRNGVKQITRALHVGWLLFLLETGYKLQYCAI